MANEITTTTTTFAGRTLRVGDIIGLGIDMGGTIYLWPAMVCSVTSTGPDECEVFGKGWDFEISPSNNTEGAWSFGSTKTRATIADMEWILLVASL